MQRGSARIGSLGDAERVDGEYQVVSIRPSAGAMSLGLGVIALMSREILARVLFDWAEWRPVNPWLWPAAIVATSLIASSLGLTFGLFGLRRRPDRSRSLAWIGVIANGTILGLVTLGAVLFLFIRWR